MQTQLANFLTLVHHNGSMMSKLIQLLCALLLSNLPAATYAENKAVWGSARAQDGDSLMVDGTRVRLFGIDAPELDQSCRRDGQSWNCGSAAQEQLANLVTGKMTMCTVVDTDQYGRQVARCSVGSIDINRTMVASGFAVAYRKYSTDFVAAEASAKAAHLGLWAGTFELPSQYRHDERAVRTTVNSTRRTTSSSHSGVQTPTSRGCVIKGNRNRKGQWIYHLPGMPYYEQTRPEEIFCSEAQAQAAGYRRAIVR
jgi:endonuclease YncB( thermonuclease family)